LRIWREIEQRQQQIPFGDDNKKGKVESRSDDAVVCEEEQAMGRSEMRGFFATAQNDRVCLAREEFNERDYWRETDDLKGGEDDGDYHQAEEEAAAVGDGVDDGIFVEVAPGGHEP
jgi:hypothetical protein